MSLTKEQILAADDIQREELEIKEWGGSVYVRMLTASEKDRLEGYLKANPFKNTRAYIGAMSVCDSAGKQLFSLDEVEALGAKSARALDRVFDVAMKLVTFTEEDVNALEKKSEKTSS